MIEVVIMMCIESQSHLGHLDLSCGEKLMASIYQPWLPTNVLINHDRNSTEQIK